MRVLICSLFFLIYTLFACANLETPKRINNITVNFSEIIEEMDISKIVSSIEYLQLETTINSQIRSITKIFCDKDNYYIYDATQSTIFHFDIEGNFIYKFNNLGRGPNEYTQITDVIYYKSQWHIFDKMTKRILIYDNQFNFRKVINMENIAYYISKINSKGYFLYTGGRDEYLKLTEYPYQLTYIDDNGIIEDHFSLYPNNRQFSSYSTFSSDELITTFSYPINDTIFIINQSGVNPNWVIKAESFNDNSIKVLYSKAFKDYIFSEIVVDNTVIKLLANKDSLIAFRKFNNNLGNVEIPIVNHLHYMGSDKIIWSIESEKFNKPLLGRNNELNNILIIGYY